MASFTDTNIPQFSPYIPTIPVEAYTKVGLFKQQQYEQGLQRVNQTYQTLADMPVDSKYSDYLDKKLGDLKKHVSNTVSGDLSNQRILNYITQSASKIAKDPVIKRAITSTANLQSALEEAKKARTTSGGKYYSPSNAAYLQEQIAQWRSNTDLTTPFTGSYIPYSDYNKHVLDALKEAGVKTTENLYTTDATTGERILNPAMVKQSGLSRERIQSIVDSALTEADKKQLAIDGWYNFRGADAPEMIATANKIYDKRIKSLTDKLDELSVKKNINPDNKERQKQVDKDISLVNEAIAEITSNKEKIPLIIQENGLDAFKSQLYLNTYRGNIVDGYSNMSTEYKTNPQWNGQMRIKEFNLRAKKYRDSQINRRNKIKFDNSLKSTAEGFGVNPIPGGTLGAVDKISDADEYVRSFVTGIDAQREDVEKRLIQIGKSLKQGSSVRTRLSNLSNTEFAKVGAQILEEWENGANVNPVLEADIRLASDAFRTFNKNIDLYNSQSQDADEKYAPKLGKALQKYDGFTFDGQSYTAEQLLAFKKHLDDYNSKAQTFATGTMEGVGIVNIINQEKFVPTSEIERKLYSYYKDGTPPSKLTKQISKIQGEANEIMDEKYDYLANKIEERTGYLQKQYFAVDVNSDQGERTLSKITSYIQSFEAEGYDQLNNSIDGYHYDPDEVHAMLTGKNATNTRVTIAVGNNNKNYIMLANSDVSDENNYIPINDAKLNRLNPEFVRETNVISSIESDILAGGPGNYTTNLSPDHNPLDARWGRSYFSKIKNVDKGRFGITADVIKANSADIYSIKLYIKDNFGDGEWHDYYIPDLTFSKSDLTSVDEILRNLNINDILSIVGEDTE